MTNKRRIINANTLEIFETMADAARQYGVSRVAVFNGVTMGTKVKGYRLVDIAEWTEWSSEEKEKYTKWNAVYFL